jgi:hypothetical protein
MAKSTRLYRISFRNHDQIFEIYAREVSHGGLLGFVEIGDLVFGEKSSVVVDPTEEKLKAQFEGVERFFAPAHAVIRIDEVTRQQGPSRITAAGESGNVMPFPIYPPSAPKS